MASDFWLVFRWWGTLFLLGAVAFPFTKALFSSWYDRGYLFSKAVGMAVVTFLVYLFGRIHLLPFTPVSIVASLFLVFVFGLVLQLANSESRIANRGKRSVYTRERFWLVVMVFLEELFFFGALVFWSWIKGHEPSIHGLEKFMDYGFTQSILNSQYFPAPDMWYVGLPINYYYFGHTVMAVLTRLSGIDLAYTFNLMLASLFAFTLTMSFSIGYQLMKISNIKHQISNNIQTFRNSNIRNFGFVWSLRFEIWNLLTGLLTAFLVTLAGNMQTIYAFTRGYTGEDVKPFWQLAWGIGEFWQKLPEGLQRYWYANATRFIPLTIHEFPSYSFVVSDVHGHVLSLPFVLLAIGLLIAMFIPLSLRGAPPWRGDAAIPVEPRLLRRGNGLAMTKPIFYGFLCGVLLMTNVLDGPIYAGLFVVLSLFFNRTNASNLTNWTYWRQQGVSIGLVALAALLASLPFLSHFTSFVSGIAVNCPPAFLANSKIGVFLFEGVEKCQHSPLWMLWLLWGFFWFCGAVLVYKFYNNYKSHNSHNRIEIVLIVFFFFSIVLIIFPEFFYFKDIYPAHFRSNTMFKLGYEAFILFSIVSGYTIVSSFWQVRHRARPESTSDAGQASMTFGRGIFLLLLIPQLFLVSIYPIFSVRSYFGELRRYEGLDGLAWLRNQYPDDYAGIQWLNSQNIMKRQQGSSTTLKARGAIMTGLPVIIEADGDSYTDFARFSAFTGLPTVIGWPVHEWLWRGSYDIVSPRREDVRLMYESDDREQTRQLLTQYGISYIIVGTLEREKFQNLQERKFGELAKIVFQQGTTAVYAVDGVGAP